MRLKEVLELPKGMEPIRSEAEGFTLIEVLVVTAIVIFIGSLGLLVGLDSYHRSELRNERSTLVGLLEEARSRAMNNFYQKPHGIHIDASAYTLFQGTAYSSADPMNEVTTVRPGITITTPPLPFDIVFNQLSGEPTPSIGGTITLAGQNNSFPISINAEGRIDW